MISYATQCQPYLPYAIHPRSKDATLTPEPMHVPVIKALLVAIGIAIGVAGLPIHHFTKFVFFRKLPGEMAKFANYGLTSSNNGLLWRDLSIGLDAQLERSDKWVRNYE
jgi:hypothetical protein